MSHDPYTNPSASTYECPNPPPSSLTQSFHASLPHFEPTRLVPLPAIAQSLGLGAVFLKSETSRLSLPSFKILGASWGTFRALCERFGLPPGESSLEDLKAALGRVEGGNGVGVGTGTEGGKLVLAAATDGNHGRAVAYMARLLGLRGRIFVPRNMHPATFALIESEGATVVRTEGDYDFAVSKAVEFAKRSEEQGEGDAVLVQDNAWEGYEVVPGVSRSVV